MRAVVLVVLLADVTLQAGLNLSSHANTVSDLDGLDLVADLDRMANDFVTDAKGERAATPTSADGVDVTGANTASLNGNVDVVVLEWLWLELRKVRWSAKDKIMWSVEDVPPSS